MFLLRHGDAEAGGGASKTETETDRCASVLKNMKKAEAGGGGVATVPGTPKSDSSKPPSRRAVVEIDSGSESRH